MRKDSIDFEARELLLNNVLGSPAKQERVCGLGDDHRSPTKQLQSWGGIYRGCALHLRPFPRELRGFPNLKPPAPPPTAANLSP